MKILMSFEIPGVFLGGPLIVWNTYDVGDTFDETKLFPLMQVLISDLEKPHLDIPLTAVDLSQPIQVRIFLKPPMFPVLP